MTAAARSGVQSVERAMAVLSALGRAGRPLSIRELAQEAALPRPTLYRLLTTLQASGAVTPAGDGFIIGPRILWLASRRLLQTDLRAVSRPYLLELRDRTRETVHLAVLEQGQVVYVDKVEAPGPLRMASTVGAIAPAHCTALGKAMLAALAQDQVDEIVARHGLRRRTARTITDPAVLHEELAAVRARGYAIDDVENEEGIRCAAAAVWGHLGGLAGGVSVSGAATTMTLARIRREVGPLVRETARRISRAMGWGVGGDDRDLRDVAHGQRAQAGAGPHALRPGGEAPEPRRDIHADVGRRVRP